MAGKAILKTTKMTISNIPQKFVSFLKEVRTEMKKVSWPSREKTINYTLIVIGVSLGTAIFLGGLDFIFTYLLNSFILNRF